VQVGSNYFLDSNSTGLGPELKYNGSPVVTGEFTAAGGGTWTLIGAEQTASGYEVAWKVAGVDQYTVWNVDSNGNYISNSILPMSGTSAAIEIVETSFHQDLNGDGVIGFPSATVIESFGSTGLVQVGSNYFLDSISTGSGPELKYNGSPVVTSEFTAAGGGTWTLIGAEQTASGYEVAWKVAGVDQYTVWNVDSNGNYITNSILPASGTSLAIESVETSFHQDLNGDGAIGTHSTAIAAASVISNTAAIVNAGATVEITTPYAGQVTFNASTGTLKLDNSSSFSGTVVGMNAQDTLDLADINFAAHQQPVFLDGTSGGTLSITDGTHTANIALLGSYMASTFIASSDGHGGTYIVDPSAPSQNNLLAQPQHA
jgi:20S proteasome alpha/beta subunit